MGRYLEALALMDRGKPKKPKEPEPDSSLGLLGTPPPCFQIIEVVNDERHWCRDCTNLTEYGYCRAAERGEIDGAGARYSPWQGLPRRCESFNSFN